MKKFALIALVLTVATVAAQATPTVTLTATTTGTVWKVWATVSSDCAGLSSFDISFGGPGGGTIVTSTVKAANFYDSDAGAIIGFGSSFKNNGTVIGGAVADIINGQATAYGDANDTSKDALIIQGCGQQAHAVMNVAGDTQLGTIATPFLLAQGTISGSLPIQAGTGIGNVLTGVAGQWVGPGNAAGATFIFSTGFTPEPTTMALLAIGGIAALRRRR